MIWAELNNEKIEAEPSIKEAVCPCCKGIVIPKCGEIKVWHWSHKNLEDCDPWYEPESIWHKKWKDELSREQQEVTIGKHRADIKTSKGVIELQSSSISPLVIEERENFYGNMIWLLNGEKLTKGLNLRTKNKTSWCDDSENDMSAVKYKVKNNYQTFRWKSPSKSWWNAKKDIYIDLGEYGKLNPFYFDAPQYFNQFKNNIFLIKKIYTNIPCGGWGVLLTKEEFLNKFRD